MKYIIGAVIMLSLLMGLGTAYAADSPFKNQEEKISYGIGFDIAQRILQQYDGIVEDQLFKGMSDSFKGKDTLVSQDELAKELSIWRQLQGAKSQAKGGTFLAENKKRDGVKSTESGLQYEVLKAGDGKTPSAEDSVLVNYRGTLIDGKEFDSSYKRGAPATFPVSGVIPGMTEALLIMKTGSKWKLYIPSDLAYGERGAGGSIGPNETLIFELELIEIK
jgi:FKBP-type peptidyl-prolyl cis-trans isomerase